MADTKMNLQINWTNILTGIAVAGFLGLIMNTMDLKTIVAVQEQRLTISEKRLDKVEDELRQLRITKSAETKSKDN